MNESEKRATTKRTTRTDPAYGALRKRPSTMDFFRKHRAGILIVLTFFCVVLLSVGGWLLIDWLKAPDHPTATTASDHSSATTVSDSRGPDITPAPLPLDGKIIFLDAGHGGYDNGCNYPEDDPVYKEKEFNLQIAIEAKKQLEALGAEVIMTRTDDSFISIYARPALVHLFCLDYLKENGLLSISADTEMRLREGMNQAIQINSTDISAGCMGAMVGSGFSDDLIELLELEYQLDHIIFISVHNNWGSNTKRHGTAVYYVTDESIIESEDRLIKKDPYYANPDYTVREHYYGRDGERNRTLARFLHDSIVASAPELNNDLPDLVTDNFAVLREQGLASVMLELTYLSNPEDRELWTDPDVVRKMAEGISNGCLYYYNNTDA